MSISLYELGKSIIVGLVGDGAKGALKKAAGTLRKKGVWGLVLVVGAAAVSAIIMVHVGRRQILLPWQYVVILTGLIAPWGVLAITLPHFPASLLGGATTTVEGRHGHIHVQHLHDTGAEDVLDLNWTTFTDGMERLIKDWRLTGGGPNLVVGVNDAGGAIASLLAGVEGKHNPLPVATVITKGTHCPPGCMVASLPCVVRLPAQADDGTTGYSCEPLGKGSVERILVADMMVRNGSTMRRVVDFLRSQYEPKRILIAELAATRVSRVITRIGELDNHAAGDFTAEHRFLPDFLAFTCPNDRVRLPHDIQ